MRGTLPPRPRGPGAAYGAATVEQPKPGNLRQTHEDARIAMTLSTRAYARANDVPVTSWRWPNFTPQELACRGSGARSWSIRGRSTCCSRCAIGWANR